MNLLRRMQAMLDQSRIADFLAPLFLRLYLAPIFWMAGVSKLAHFSDTVEWFGNSEWGLGLPLPWLMAFLATTAEVVGAVLLLIGLGVRWIAPPLIITMLVAALTTHLQHGWQAIADPGFCLFDCADAIEASKRLDAAREILQAHGNYDWLTEQGAFAILNNGVEFAVTYFIMLMALFFIGAGRFVSIDYWLARRITKTA